MIKAEDYLNELFSVKQIAQAASCKPSLIMKYIQDGVRGTGHLRVEHIDNLGHPWVSLAALNEFGLRHSGYARRYAIKALKTLRGEIHESH